MQGLIRKAARRLSRAARECYYSVLPNKAVLAAYEARPQYLTIETTNVCNANCTFCAYQYLERPKQVMTDQTYALALAQYFELGGGGLGVSTIVGDPLLDPRFVARIVQARSSPLIKEIGTTTNCLHLHKVGAEKLLTSGISSIMVSTTGFDAEMYHRIYRSTRYIQMRDNVLDLLRTNKRLGSPVKITISLRLDRPPAEVIAYPDFQEVKDLATAVDWNAYFDNWNGRIKQADLTGNMKLRSHKLLVLKPYVPCSQLYGGIGILADGTVTACACRDLEGKSDLVLGNINQLSLKEMWHGHYLKGLRDNWSSKRVVPDICADCTHYNPYTYLMLAEVRNRN